MEIHTYGGYTLRNQNHWQHKLIVFFGRCRCRYCSDVLFAIHTISGIYFMHANHYYECVFLFGTFCVMRRVGLSASTTAACILNVHTLGQSALCAVLTHFCSVHEHKCRNRKSKRNTSNRNVVQLWQRTLSVLDVK